MGTKIFVTCQITATFNRLNDIFTLQCNVWEPFLGWNCFSCMHVGLRFNANEKKGFWALSPPQSHLALDAHISNKGVHVLCNMRRLPTTLTCTEKGLVFCLHPLDAHMSNKAVHVLCNMRRLPTTVMCTEKGLVFRLHAHEHLNMIIMTMLYFLCQGWMGRKSL